jgi:pilus assembly protein CpaC
MNSDVPDEHEFYFNGHIEVPNLKGDNCFESRADDYCPTEAGYEGGMLIDEQSIIVPGGLGQNRSSRLPVQQPGDPSMGSSSAAKIASARPTSNTVESESRPQQADELFPNSPTRQVNFQPAASSARRLGEGRASRSVRSGVESGTLIPSTAIRPGNDPQIVGEGVVVSQPTRR